jgi:hypothetical protein
MRHHVVSQMVNDVAEESDDSLFREEFWKKSQRRHILEDRNL